MSARRWVWGWAVSVVLGSLGWASAARAETGWLASSVRFDVTQRYALFGGPGSVGAGLQWTASARRAFAVEAAWNLRSRFAELRGDHAWQLARGSWAALRAEGGASLYAVPGPWDVGLGPHVGLALQLGRPWLNAQLGLQSGVDLFARGPGLRLPQRLLLGLTGAVGPLGWGLLARVGADLEPGRAFVARAEAVLLLSWDRIGG